MKEKLTIDQKIQIARMTADIVQTAMECDKAPGGLLISGSDVKSEQALFQGFYRAIVETITDESEHI
ncbi:hypothetical protein [Salmonella enterica]|uniref:hypothetical protein n=1 Tax=Salmonella enterica TaxID=28901 RepID=UPI0009A9FD92|nr:hypothetical protein [Salmonella enterica]EEU8018367.1 hypothetical protein [Salmonella enterica subsp. enterica serovar Montevideo]EAS1999546.1 hypothetical protein [Salmonella enterica]EAY8674145.1 hypothetical protein [Salmonella enterica]EBC0167310.1 hypothetical protein [Salmonella enterica]EDB0137737.1 hypothetical protein [Salmonella enterica]